MSVSLFGNQERQGNCHHCGWNQPLRKVTGQEAARIRRSSVAGPRTGLRWLCDECIADLTSVQHGERVLVHADSIRLVPATPARHRSVA